MLTDLGALYSLTALKLAMASPSSVGVVDFKLVLFQAAVVPARGLLWSGVDTDEADFVGYARQSLSACFTNAPAMLGGVPKLLGTEVTFLKTTGAANQTIFGFGIVSEDIAGNAIDLVQALNFSVSKTLTDAQPSIQFTPFIGKIPV